jgi:uncharacterized alkaline shock family protein YloU
MPEIINALFGRGTNSSDDTSTATTAPADIPRFGGTTMATSGELVDTTVIEADPVGATGTASSVDGFTEPDGDGEPGDAADLDDSHEDDSPASDDADDSEDADDLVDDDQPEDLAGEDVADENVADDDLADADVADEDLADEDTTEAAAEEPGETATDKETAEDLTEDADGEAADETTDEASEEAADETVDEATDDASDDATDEDDESGPEPVVAEAADEDEPAEAEAAVDNVTQLEPVVALVTAGTRPAAGDRGSVTVGDGVVAKVVTIVAGKVDGVHSLDDDGITVEVDDDVATITISLVVEFGHPIRALAEEIRTGVVESVEQFLGLDVAAVDVLVSDIHVPDAG